MFLHIQSFDKQYSVNSQDEREEEDKKIPAENLMIAIKTAMDYWKQTGTVVAYNEDLTKKLDMNKSAKENGLNENDFVVVNTQENIDKKLEARKEQEVNA